MYLTFHYKKKHLQAICYTLITTKGKNTFHLPYTYYIIGTQHTHKHKKNRKQPKSFPILIFIMFLLTLSINKLQ